MPVWSLVSTYIFEDYEPTSGHGEHAAHMEKVTESN